MHDIMHDMHVFLAKKRKPPRRFILRVTTPLGDGAHTKSIRDCTAAQEYFTVEQIDESSAMLLVIVK